ncbi:hypothetical protein L873DRAFT_1797957 [Choiromyces venosus 120613-1]|uniref:Uncharacterized protein n=1 Tax=Choiromyces venosus 120613-1 TaxID=1336337 RepID=A0A3N4KAV1_9PEZI|nr:hypothetical protein L873DRAFT_1797957 [Choiromyces venosus 120613-1]
MSSTLNPSLVPTADESTAYATYLSPPTFPPPFSFSFLLLALTKADITPGTRK